MKHSIIRLTGLSFAVLGIALILTACAGAQGEVGPQGPQGPAGPPGEAGLPGEVFVVPGEGLTVEITGVDFSTDGKPVVSLRITDAEGRPLAAESLEPMVMLTCVLRIREHARECSGRIDLIL
jgi:hypothetical protein